MAGARVLRRRAVAPAPPLAVWIVFVVALIAVTLSLADVGLRLRRDRVAAQLGEPAWTDHRFQPDRLLRYTNRPGYSYTSENRRHEVLHYANNSLGLRGPEISRAKPPGHQRVIVVGGSTVYGALDDQPDTLPAQLETILHQHIGSNVEVLNGGVPGYEALREAAYTKVHLLDLAPDVIVVVDGLNDVFYGSLEEWPAQVAEDQLRLIADGRLPELVSTVDQTMFPLPFGLVEHQATMLVRSARRSALRALHRPPLAEPRAANEHVIALHAECLARIADYGRQRGIPVIAALQPLLVLGNKPLSAEEEEAVQREDYWDPQGWPAVARVMYPQMDATTRASITAAVGRYLDLTHAFDGEPETLYAEDVAHYTRLGNRRLAELLAPAVREALEQ